MAGRDREAAHYRKAVRIFLSRFEAVIDPMAFSRRRHQDGVFDAGILHHGSLAIRNF
jgi:hypothetical protein